MEENSQDYQFCIKVALDNAGKRIKMIKNSDKGITAQTSKDGTSINIGAVRKIPLFALVGIIISLETNFKTSAMG